MPDDHTEPKLSDRVKTLEDQLAGRWQFFRTFLAAVLIVIVFLAGSFVGYLMTFNIAAASCNETSKCCDKIDQLKVTIENKTSLEARFKEINERLDAMEKTPASKSPAPNNRARRR